MVESEARSPTWLLQESVERCGQVDESVAQQEEPEIDGQIKAIPSLWRHSKIFKAIQTNQLNSTSASQ